MKRIIAVALIFITLLSGCQSGAFSLEDGLYVLEQAENGGEAVMETSFGGKPYKIAFRLIGDNRLKFVSAKSDISCGEEIRRDGMVFALAKSEAGSAAGNS